MPKVTKAHLEARRLQILAATCKCVSQNGFHRTTMQDICRTADLSPGAVYGYFSSKEEIITALGEEGLRQTEALFAQLAAADDVGKALSDFFKLTLLECSSADTATQTDRLKVTLWAEALRSPEVFALLHRSHDAGITALENMIRDGLEHRSVRGTLDATATAHVIISLLEGFVLQRTIDPSIDAARYCATVGTLLKHGLKPDHAE